VGFLYTQFQPEAGARHIIDAYWINRSSPTVPSRIADRVLPDGCIDLIFRGGNRGTPRLFISPLIEEAAPMNSATSDWFVGVRFRPAMSRVVLDVAPEQCLNHEHAAREVEDDFKFLEDELSRCVTPDEALSLLRRSVSHHIKAHADRVPPPRIRHAVTLLQSINPDGNGIAFVAESLGITTRSLHRDILRWTGHSPKVFARILRMQTAMRNLRNGSASIAEVSAATGYADQAHMTREFRRLTGATPGSYSQVA
jgi:AraC-like DNA-binding protein